MLPIRLTCMLPIRCRFINNLSIVFYQFRLTIDMISIVVIIRIIHDIDVIIDLGFLLIGTHIRF